MGMLEDLKNKGEAPEFLTDEAFQMLSGGYLQYGETPKDAYHRVANVCASYFDIKNLDKIFFDLMWKNWLCPSTPVLANSGTNNLQISCFSSRPSDDTYSIMEHVTELAMLTKYGGGVGSSFNDLRAKGTPISKGGASDGIIPFLKILEMTVEGIKQGPTRRGSVASYLNFDHGDIDEFLDVRKPTGDLSRRCLSTSFHNAVGISDSIMEDIVSGNSTYRERWNKLMNNRVETGEAYILFTGNANRNCPDYYRGRITQSNLCVAPETLILTSKGYQKIEDLENKNVLVWNGEEFTDTVVKKTGSNQKLIKVVTDCGPEIECTEYHKFYVIKNFSRSKIVEMRASDLKPGMKLIKFELPCIEGDKILSKAYINGFYSGDGCEVKGKQRIYLYGEKRKLKPRFGNVSWYTQEAQDREIAHYDDLESKFFVPDANYTIQSRLDWFAGFLDADGTLALSDGHQSIQMASINLIFLKQIQLMLQTLGITSKIKLARKAGQFILPANDGTSDGKLFNCQEVYRLLISGSGIEQLVDLGINCGRISFKKNGFNRSAERFIKIKEIKDEGRVSDTFCFTEKSRNMGMFNGVLAGNCIEIMEPVSYDETFVCCLSSLNLSKYREWKDWKCPTTGFTLVELSIMFLDSVISNFINQARNIPGLEKAVRFAENHRALGLGVLGWHTLLQQENLPFASFQSMMLNSEIFSKIKEESDKMTLYLGSKYGECKETVGTGRRNAVTLAIAPTMSNSVFSGGVSQGIEPITANLFVQKSAKGNFIKKNSLLVKLLQEKGLDNFDTWNQINKDSGSVRNVKGLSQEERNIFLTAREIDQFALIQQAAQRQKFIDQSQSLNLFYSLPRNKEESVKVAKYINECHLEAWRLGVKSLYYLKTGSPIKGSQLFVNKEESCLACEG